MLKNLNHLFKFMGVLPSDVDCELDSPRSDQIGRNITNACICNNIYIIPSYDLKVML